MFQIICTNKLIKCGDFFSYSTLQFILTVIKTTENEKNYSEYRYIHFGKGKLNIFEEHHI